MMTKVLHQVYFRRDIVDIEKVLDKIQERITNSLTELDVKCTADELNAVCSIFSLSMFKLKHPIPVDFIPAVDCASCYVQCISTPNYYKILEFIYLSNPCVQKNIEFIFPQMSHE